MALAEDAGGVEEPGPDDDEEEDDEQEHDPAGEVLRLPEVAPVAAVGRGEEEVLDELVVRVSFGGQCS